MCSLSISERKNKEHTVLLLFSARESHGNGVYLLFLGIRSLEAI